MSSNIFATRNPCTDAATRKASRPRHVRLRFATAMVGMLLFAGAHAGTSGNIAITSDYVFRGVSQSNQDPALQGGFEFAADKGVYVGTWGSSISWLSDLSSTAAPISSSLELDVYGGYRGQFNDTVSYDVGVLYYWYPGDFPSGFNSADTTEVYAGISIAASEAVSLSAKYSHAVSDLFGYEDSNGSGYLDLGANWALADGWSLSAHAGKQWIQGNRAFEYSDWKLGVGKAFDNGFSVGLAYTGTDAEDALYTNPYGNKVAGDAFALTVTKAF